MTSYLLPCTCGKQLPVTASQAGQAVRCECGIQLEVPTLRGLQQLPHAGEGKGRAAVVWDDRKRTAFLLVLFSLCAIGVAGYLFRNMPPAIYKPTDHEIEAAFKSGSPQDLQTALQFFEKGIDYSPADVAYVEARVLETRGLMGWGMAIALALAACGAGAAVWALNSADRSLK